MKRIIAAFFHSIAGLRHGFLNEAAIRQEIILLLVSIPIAPFLAKDMWHLLLLWGVILFILLTELLNTGIEKVADRVTKEFSEEIKVAKDCGSAAVLVVSTIALAVWGLSVWEWWMSI